MTVRLRYDLTGVGWAECAVEIDGARAVVTASYLSDALDALGAATAAVLQGEPEATAAFDEEPGEYRWRLARVGADRLRVRILEFDELWGGRPDAEGRPLLDAECRLRTFAGAVVAELQRLLAEHGEAGYEARWAEHAFPRGRLDELERLLAERRESGSRPEQAG